MPEHFLDQAKKLIQPQGRGAPRQVDMRRVISACYYAVFHFVVREVADQYIGRAQRGPPLHVLAYRSVDHRKLASLCADVREAKGRAAKYWPGHGFSKQVRDFAGSALELREKRNSADYDPSLKFRMADAAAVIATAQNAIERFASADPEERRAFLALLVFLPR